MTDNGLGSWPARRARKSPGRVALVHKTDRLSYADLDERVNRLATALRRLRVRPGDRVAYLGPNHPAFVETLFATAALGATFVPLNTRLAAVELAYMLGDSGASTLVFAADQVEKVNALPVVPALRQRISVEGEATAADHDYQELIDEAAPDRIEIEVALDDAAMIMYTSGTTGSPKGAVLTHGNLTWNCVNLLIDLDLRSDEVALISAPMFHTAALNHTALPVFLKGGTSVLLGGFDPAATLDLIAAHRVTLMFGVPTMFRQIAQSPRWTAADLTSLRILHCGGAPVPAELIRTYQDRGLNFVQGYGMTEASPGALLLPSEHSTDRIGSAGTPHFFTDVRVVRPDGATAGAGETGEIVVRGPNVMKGYWQRPEETGIALADGWLHTGDAAVTDEDGFFYVVDRIKDMIISGGENIYPAEVEKVLHEHPAVRDCAVIGVPDQLWGEVGRAVLVLREGSEVDAGQIADFLSDRIARYKIPKTVVFAKTLPHNASGKMMRAELRTAYGAP